MREKDENIDHELTEQRIWIRLVEIFGGEPLGQGGAYHFMNTPHPELGGATPKELCATPEGVQRVSDVIDWALHGFPV